MRIIALSLAIILLLTGPALAVAPVNTATIKTAQDYGRSKAELPLTDFLQPWTVYEEKAVRLDEAAERACFYTPFLLIAADARDRAAAGGLVNVADAEKVLTDYNGYVIFGVTLTGVRADFTDKFTASLRQGRKSFKPHIVHASPAVAEGSPPYQVHVYFYFASRDIALDKTSKLTVSAADKRLRTFRLPFSEYW